MNNKPLVSIGMPVYNGESFLHQALNSLLRQSCDNFELIISDNASTDNTRQICLEYSRQDPRIKYYRNKINMGGIWNFNRVFDLTSGEYFMWASYDDYWDPRYISLCIEGFGISNSVVLVGAICKYVDFSTEELIFIDQGLNTVGLSTYERFKKYKYTIHSGKHIGAIFFGIYKRSVLAKVMPLKKVLAIDHLLLAGLSLLGEFITVPEKLMLKRSGGCSRSLQGIAEAAHINNKLFIKFPYFVRELLLQKIIFTTSRLRFWEKITLAFWSFVHYLKIFIIPFSIIPPVFKILMRRFFRHTDDIFAKKQT